MTLEKALKIRDAIVFDMEHEEGASISEQEKEDLLQDILIVDDANEPDYFLP